MRTLATKSVNAGDPTDFDINFHSANVSGSLLDVNTGGAEEAGKTGKKEGLTGDGAATFPVSFVTTTDLKITCKTNDVQFQGAGEGKGSIRVRFQDGADEAFIVLGSAGTGYSKSAVIMKAEGHLTYSDQKALSSGEGEADLKGSVSAFGLSVDFTPKVGEQQHKDSLAGNDTKAVTGKTFQWTLKNHISTVEKVDDSSVGRASAGQGGRVTHAATVHASHCGSGTEDSTIDFTLVDGDSINYVKIKIVTVDTATSTTVENIDTQIFYEPFTNYTNANGTTGSDETGWGPPGNKWVRPHLPEGIGAATLARHGRLGVRRGDVFEFSVRSAAPLFRRFETMRFRVLGIRHSGWLRLAARTDFRNGKVDRDAFSVNPFTGKGEILGLVIPRGLKVGDELYGIGRVVAVGPVSVRIVYSSAGARATAVYDRRTGLLRTWRERGSRGHRLALTRTLFDPA